MKRELSIISYLISIFCLKDTLIVNKFLICLLWILLIKISRNMLKLYLTMNLHSSKKSMNILFEIFISQGCYPAIYKGRILSFISQIKKPKNILEIGTYTGYSALCRAEGLSTDGKLITIDKDKSLYSIVGDFLVGLSMQTK